MLVRIISLALFAFVPVLAGCDDPATLDRPQDRVEDTDPERNGTLDRTPSDLPDNGIDDTPDPIDPLAPENPSIDPIPMPAPLPMPTPDPATVPER